jgi:hypothetical protein
MKVQLGNDRVFDGLPHDWIPTPGFQECPPSAVKVLVAIIHIWVAGGFRNNGNLPITFKMLQNHTAIKSRTTLSLCIDQLEALGLITVDRGKWKAGGVRESSRYGVTWAETEGNSGGRNGGPATKAYLEITTREEARRLLEAVKDKHKNPKTTEVDGVVEFKAKLRTTK